jgi:hypothetical protein
MFETKLNLIFFKGWTKKVSLKVCVAVEKKVIFNTKKSHPPTPMTHDDSLKLQPNMDELEAYKQ